MLTQLRHIAAAFCAAIFVAVTGGAHAASSYNFAISYSEPMLAAYGTPEEADVAHYESWDSAIARIRKRNMPFIEITNTSTSATPLTQFTMSIAKPEYDFSDDVLLAFAKLGTSTPGISMMSSSPDGGDTLLVVDFTDGLQPNEVARFQVDIDVDPAFPDLYPYPDYRMVFFDINGDDNSDNSVITATFETANGATTTQTNVLPDYEQNPVYLNGGGLRPYTEMDPAERFDLTGEIPEPSSAAIAVLSLIAARGFGRRR